MTKDGFPEIGDIITIKGEIISQSGSITFYGGEKVTVSEVEISKGYWSRLCPDIWEKPRLRWVKIEGHYGCWLPGSFEETFHFKK